MSLSWDNQRATGNVAVSRTITSHFMLICDQLHFTQFHVNIRFSFLLSLVYSLIVSIRSVQVSGMNLVIFQIYFNKRTTITDSKGIRDTLRLWMITLCEQQNSRVCNVIFKKSNEWFKYQRKVLMIYCKLLNTSYRISIDLTSKIMYFLTTWVWYSIFPVRK